MDQIETGDEEQAGSIVSQIGTRNASKNAEGNAREHVSVTSSTIETGIEVEIVTRIGTKRGVVSILLTESAIYQIKLPLSVTVVPFLYQTRKWKSNERERKRWIALGVDRRVDLSTLLVLISRILPARIQNQKRLRPHRNCEVHSSGACRPLLLADGGMNYQSFLVKGEQTIMNLLY